MNKKRYINAAIIVTVIVLCLVAFLIWHHFEKKKSPVYLFQSLTNENVEIEMYGYTLTLEEKTECIELLKKLTSKNVSKARRDNLGTTPEYGYRLKTQDKEYILYEEYSIFGQGTIYYKGEYWFIKSKGLKKLMKEHYEKYKNIAAGSKWDFTSIDQISSFCLKNEYFSEHKIIIKDFTNQFKKTEFEQIAEEENQIQPALCSINLYNKDEKLYEILFFDNKIIKVNGEYYQYKGIIDYARTYTDIFWGKQVKGLEKWNIKSISVYYMGEEYISSDTEIIGSFAEVINKFGTIEPCIWSENNSFAGGYLFNLYMKSGNVESINIIDETTLDISGQCLKIQNPMDLEFYQNINLSVIEHGTIAE